MDPAQLLQKLTAYLQRLSNLDPRSLALFRILLAAVILYDISQSWAIIDVWPGLHDFYEDLPLPALLGVGSEPITLKLLYAIYAVTTLTFLVGYKTRWSCLAVWIITCGHQYAGRATIDYHHVVLVNLLIWCQALDLGQRFSLDAWHRFTLYRPAAIKSFAQSLLP
jgi:hypothetical protein